MSAKVSVITPTYNSETFISQTIDSVLNQSHKNLELILVDDASTDGTRDILEKYRLKDTRVRTILLNENGGSGIARNKGIENASGRYLAFVDSDDYWHCDKLVSQLEFMRTNNYSFTYTSYAFINESGSLERESNVAPNKCNYLRLLIQNCIGCSTVVVDMDVLGKEYMPDLRNRQDWGLWLKYIRKSGKAYRLTESNTFYRIRKNSISSNKFKLLKYHWQIYRQVEGYNAIFAMLLFALNIPTVLFYILRNR